MGSVFVKVFAKVSVKVIVNIFVKMCAMVPASIRTTNQMNGNVKTYIYCVKTVKTVRMLSGATVNK